jgi:diguanylate cyclase (GGDEF)-like protein
VRQTRDLASLLELGDGLNGPAIVGFFHRFADPAAEGRFQTAMEGDNRRRFLLVLGAVAIIAVCGLIGPLLGLSHPALGVQAQAGAAVDLAICAIAAHFAGQLRGPIGLEAVAGGFAAALLAERILSFHAGGAEVDAAGLICLVMLLYIGIPLRPLLLAPLTVAGSIAMLVAWQTGRGALGDASTGSVAIWVGMSNAAGLAGLRMIRLLLRRQWAQSQTLRHMALHDALTGIANRRFFDVSLRREWADAAVVPMRPISVVLIDVDFFKLLNDRFGHAAGDACLRDLAVLLQTCTQHPRSVVCRTGGEEFAFLLPDVAAAGAMACAERVAARLAEAGFAHPCSPLGQSLTVSMGVATAFPSQGCVPGELVTLADKLVYVAKRDGRNTIRHQMLGADGEATHAPVWAAWPRVSSMAEMLGGADD